MLWCKQHWTILLGNVNLNSGSPANLASCFSPLGLSLPPLHLPSSCQKEGAPTRLSDDSSCYGSFAPKRCFMTRLPSPSRAIRRSTEPSFRPHPHKWETPLTSVSQENAHWVYLECQLTPDPLWSQSCACLPSGANPSAGFPGGKELILKLSFMAFTQNWFE